MKKLFGLIAVLLLSQTYILINKPTEKYSWAYDILNIPVAETTTGIERPIVVAVVDDGFRLTHNELKDIIFQHPGEVPGNQLDDDGNDYEDDVNGWDVSDDDNDVSVMLGREKEFPHGTYIASIITQVAKRYFGESASQRIKIMPVKAISDFAQHTYVKDGYNGIKYAIDNGADIVCIPWSGGEPGREERKILKEAHEKGVLLIGSAGNFWEEKVYYPAQSEYVFAVAGIDSNLQRYEKSNFGKEIDISAPAQYIWGAHPEQDNAYIHEFGTSPATAFVAGCAAVLKAINSSLTSNEIEEAIINSATPFSANFHKYGGKMGSGIVNMGDAIDYIINPGTRAEHFSSLRPQGTVIFDKNSSRTVEIRPPGAYHGFYLEPNSFSTSTKEGSKFSIYVNDTVWQTYKLQNLPKKLFVPYSSLVIDAGGIEFKDDEIFKIKYSGKTIDSTTLFCSGTKYYTIDKQIITDGSGDNNYANSCSCKWIITAPIGKTIKFTFTKMNTQGNIDFVYLVDGQTAVPSNFIAKFSGPNMPPVVFSRTNEVLVWFVTDDTVTGEGWEFTYEFVE